MSLSESREFSSATVKDNGNVEVRIDRVIKSGEEEISRIPHRHVLSPGDDLSGQHAKVQEIAKAAWKSLKPKGKE